MIKSIAVFVPYFADGKGNFPNFFPCWLQSASANSSVDFYIPTNIDVHEYESYPNVKFVEMSVKDYYEAIEKLVGFGITHNCKKIGEYRPLCPYIFKDLVDEYDYWGYSELDLIYGNIRKFIDPYIEKELPIIGNYGHFRLIKNDDEFNSLAFSDSNNGLLTMKEAFQTDVCCHFDETQGMGIRYYLHGLDVVRLGKYIADIDQKYIYFSIIGRSGKWKFKWKNGSLIGMNTDISSKDRNFEEFLYVHFQKRAMDISKININAIQEFFMTPNLFSDDEGVLLERNPSTFTYTLKNRIQYYQKNKKDEEVKGSIKDVLDATSKFCMDNSLF